LDPPIDSLVEGVILKITLLYKLPVYDTIFSDRLIEGGKRDLRIEREFKSATAFASFPGGILRSYSFRGTLRSIS
jgi:hypothetical protein